MCLYIWISLTPSGPVINTSGRTVHSFQQFSLVNMNDKTMLYGKRISSNAPFSDTYSNKKGFLKYYFVFYCIAFHTVTIGKALCLGRGGAPNIMLKFYHTIWKHLVFKLALIIGFLKKMFDADKWKDRKVNH